MNDNHSQAEKQQKGTPVYIVTGATDSMGSVISRRLAEKGLPVVLSSRDNVKAEAYAAQLRTTTGNQDIQTLQLDLSSFELVRDYAHRLEMLGRPVAALINNAGILPRHSKLSPNGYEHTVQVNYLSTALLTLLVYPMIEEEGHIIFSTSITRRMVTLPYEFPAVNHFTQLGAFAQSKLALTLFSIYLSTTLKTRLIRVNCVNPGVIKSSALVMRRWIDHSAEHLSLHLPNPEAGVIPTLRALESDETGYIFSGKDHQEKTTSMLKNRELFIRLCNDTMRILRKYLPESNR